MNRKAQRPPKVAEHREIHDLSGTDSERPRLTLFGGTERTNPSAKQKAGMSRAHFATEYVKAPTKSHTVNTTIILRSPVLTPRLVSKPRPTTDRRRAATHLNSTLFRSRFDVLSSLAEFAKTNSPPAMESRLETNAIVCRVDIWDSEPVYNIPMGVFLFFSANHMTGYDGSFGAASAPDHQSLYNGRHRLRGYTGPRGRKSGLRKPGWPTERVRHVLLSEHQRFVHHVRVDERVEEALRC